MNAPRDSSYGVGLDKVQPTATPKHGGDDDVLFQGFGPGFGIEWLEKTFITQSIIFYADLLPAIYQCSISLGKPVRICDIGSASGAGANFVLNALNSLLGWPAEMTCFDLDRRYSRYVEVKFPNLIYNVGDIFDHEQDFDLCIASHVIEHVQRPKDFVGAILDRTKLAICYVPYREEKLIPGHINRFDNESIGDMPGLIWGRIMRSTGWRTESSSAVAVFVCASTGGREGIDLKELISRLDDEYDSARIL